jgi:ankyrin repeat protein
MAIAAKCSSFVKELLQWMTPDDLELKDTNGDTALCSAAVSGNVKIAEAMVIMNNNLPLIRDGHNILPFLIASFSEKQRHRVVFILYHSF